MCKFGLDLKAWRSGTFLFTDTEHKRVKTNYKIGEICFMYDRINHSCRWAVSELMAKTKL